MEPEVYFPNPGEPGFVGPKTLTLQMYDFCDIWVNGGGRIRGYGWTARKAGYNLQGASRKGAELMSYTLVQRQIYEMDRANRDIKEAAFRTAAQKIFDVIEEASVDQIAPERKVALLLSVLETTKDYDKIPIGSTRPLHDRGGRRTPSEDSGEPVLDESTERTLQSIDASLAALGEPDPVSLESESSESSDSASGGS